jgi:hypothetical protein
VRYDLAAARASGQWWQDERTDLSPIGGMSQQQREDQQQDHDEDEEKDEENDSHTVLTGALATRFFLAFRGL